MGELVLGAVVPHPPIMIREVGKGEIIKVKATREAMEYVGRELARLEPETIVVITPHGAVFADAITLPAAHVFIGSLRSFGAPQVKLQFSRDEYLAKLLDRSCQKREIPLVSLDRELAGQYGASLELDHGIVVPMSFFYQLTPKPLLLPINMGLLMKEQLYLFGIALQEAIQKSGRRVAVIASGDLSHRLTKDAPGGYNPRGKEFDLRVKTFLENFDVPGILSIPEEIQEEAGECGYRPIVMLLGILDGFEVHSQVLSYEAPFGVGYLAAQMLPLNFSAEKKLWPKLQEQRKIRLEERRKKESPIVQLARQSLEHYYALGDSPGKTQFELPSDLPAKAGAFVTLKKDERLRGCIGTIEPTKSTLTEEIISNAIKAATQDPRFDSVASEELEELAISVDVLGVPETIAGLEDLDPQIYGVIVRSGWRTGLLLPALEGVKTAEEQVDIARKKGGIAPHEPIKLARFKVTRFT